MQIQQISVQNEQAAQPGPAGGGRTPDGNTFRSILNAKAARADSDDAEAKASSDRPEEKSGEKREGSGAAPQAGASNPGAVLPDLLLSPGVQPSPAGVPADGDPGALPAVSAAQGPASGAAAVLPASNAGQDALLSVTAAQTAPVQNAAVQTSAAEQTAPVSQQASESPGPEADFSAPAAAQQTGPPSGESEAPRPAGTPAAQPQTVTPEAPARRDAASGPQSQIPGQTAESEGQAPVSAAQPQSETAVSGRELPEPSQNPAARRSEPKAADDPDGLPGLYGGGNVVIRVSGERTAAAAAPVRQVADAALQQMQNGKSEFRMDLYPESLGKVSVRLTSERGILTVEIAASDPKTQSLLLSGSEELRSILQSSGGQQVQTVLPDRQAAAWYGQPQDGGGNGNAGERRKKREDAQRSAPIRIESGGAEFSTGDFLALIQSVGASAR